MEPGSEARIPGWSGHSTVKSGASSAREVCVFVHGKVTAMVSTILIFGKLGDMEVFKLMAVIHNAQISLFSNDLSVLVASMTGMLLDNVVCLNAALGVRVVLRSVEYGVGVLHHERLLRLRVASLIGLSRPIGIHS